jgi:hypothetical protein
MSAAAAPDSTSEGDHLIRPTVTQRVRAFLCDQGAQVQAWSGLDETYAALYALLNRRRDDPAFWPPVRALLQEIVDTAQREGCGGAGVETTELLASWDLDALVAGLRAALPGGDAPVDAGVVQRFASRLSAAVMGGFLLLGLAAAGCAPRTASSVLNTSIDSSRSLTADHKAYLRTCFATLRPDWRDGLAELFRTGTAEEIAGVLREMVNCCSYPPSLAASFGEAREKLRRRENCPVPVYKGVSFPR